MTILRLCLLILLAVVAMPVPAAHLLPPSDARP